jgi:DNA polymerase elongation subunit (family B)
VDDDDDDDDDNDDDDTSVAGAEGEKEEQVEEVTWGRPKKTVNGYKKTGTVVDLMEDSSVDSDTKIMELNKTLSSIFPKLKGDIVTFIGSTFLRYGDSKPYMNHCIVRDTCSEMPHVENSVLESYASEKDVLLAWTRLIQRENPDIVIGYNIFGFDYQFMYQRSRELGITRPFLQLSRNKGEVCLKKNWKTGKEGLEENTIVIASGQHDLKFVNMTGRLQIDLYNYLRRDYNLTKYKLDYVSGYFIGDGVKSITHECGNTIVKSGNLSGLDVGSYINFEEEAHSVDSYKDGAKFQVIEINKETSTFLINSEESPDMTKKVRWGLAKDDVTPQDIFRMTNEGPDERALIAKYCIQDCNLVHHLLNKIDVITGYVEMANLCSVPLDFLVMRGQGIKLTSYLAKKCREKGTLMPVLDKANSDEGYEGAIVLPPKSDLYLEEPVACVDYSSLYPSSMISENISPDSKVWTKEYDLDGNLLQESGERDKDGNFMYDNLPNYKYVDISYDAYSWRRKTPSNPKSAMMKVKVGTKTCRFAQFPDGELGILPSILKECLAARKATRKLIPQEKDEFMKNVLDKRQLSIKVTANSMYGQTGAKTSTFYEKDVAASTTATGRKLLTYAQRVIEEAYKDRTVVTKEYGEVRTNAEYVYGDTDSVFFKFNLTELDGTPILGQKALEITIELAQQAGELATMFLKAPHDLEYEKTFLPFCLLSKKRYVGMLYELDPNKCKRKSMGIVLKRRDNAPVVKDVYGGIIDILMKDKDIEKAARFLEESLRSLVDGEIGLDKLIITKSLRGHYKNPKQIAHKVLADRIGQKGSGEISLV